MMMSDQFRRATFVYCVYHHYVAVYFQMRLTSWAVLTATVMIIAASKAWVATDMAAPTVATLVSWTIPPLLKTSDTQPGVATLPTGTSPVLYPSLCVPPFPPLRWCSQPDFAVRWPAFFSWQICFGRHTYLSVCSSSGKSITGNIDDETLEDSKNPKKKQKMWSNGKKHTKTTESLGVCVFFIF